MTSHTIKRRAKVTTTEVAKLRRWEAVDQPIAIVEVTSRLGLPRRWLVIQKADAGEFVASAHRSKRAAMRNAGLVEPA